MSLSACMAFAKKDLTDFRKIVREEVESEVQSAKEGIESRIFDVRTRLTTEVWAVRDRTKNVEITAKRLEKDTGAIKKTVQKLDKKLDNHFNFLDRSFAPRIKRFEDNAGLSPLPQI